MSVKSKNIIPSYPKLSKVTVTDSFFGDFLKKISQISARDILKKFISEGLLDNYKRVANGEKGGHSSFPWYHGLICECIRGISDLLVQSYDAELDAELENIIEHIGMAQAADPDGFINPYTTLMRPHQRFGKNGGDILWQHETYNSGCLAEAGAHHYLATGKTALLKIAVKNWNYYADFIGDAPKHNVVCEHSIPEKALLKLYEIFTENENLAKELGARPQEYLRLVRYFVDHKGDNETRYSEPKFLREYAQDHRPAREQREAVGHAVRATLFYEGMTALAIEDDDEELKKSAIAIHKDIELTKLHINGSVGAFRNEEKFGPQYYLPNDAYLETCAGVGLVFFETEMFKLLKDASSFEIIESTLYNLLPAAVSADGVRYTYENPLQSKGDFEHWEWHPCPCCPPMLLKMAGCLPSLIFAQSDKNLWLNLFIDSTVTLDGGSVSLSNKKVTVKTEKDILPLSLRIRIPSWTRNFSVKVNGNAFDFSTENGYAVIDRNFANGDEILLEYDVPIVKYEAHPYVKDDEGRVAIKHGPVLYCIEGIDNPAKDFDEFDFVLSDKEDLTFDGNGNIVTKDVDGKVVTFVPYRDWNNRDKGLMRVWVKENGLTSDTVNTNGWEEKLYRHYKEFNA